MINVQEVIKHIPHFETFCSVEKLHGLVDRLRADPRFEISVAGASANGVPIHHVRFGKGSVKALLVGFPHCMEPIGGLTVYSLMTLLQQGNRALLEADVEWHIVPCIDPDGARLNEGWSQKPFTLENYMKNYYLEANQDQVDTSFPITYKRLTANKPSQEARILQGVLDRVQPDFYFSLHNAHVGGAFYYLGRDIDHQYHKKLYELLEQQSFPLQRRPIWSGGVNTQFGEGILEMWSIKRYYDFLEQTEPRPEEHLWYGGSSLDYLVQIKPSALTFVAELGYVRHPNDESEKETGQHLRQFKLRLDADTKFLATVLLEVWEKVKGDVDTGSALYRAASYHALPSNDKLMGSIWPLSRFPTRDALFNPDYARTMTEGDRFNACMVDGGFCFLRWSYQFVRLLKNSPQTPAVRQGIERLDRAFDEALSELSRHVDFDAFKVVDCDTLARVQLGSGLIVLNSLLEKPVEAVLHSGPQGPLPLGAV